MAGVTTHPSTRGCKTLEMVLGFLSMVLTPVRAFLFFSFLVLPREWGSYVCRIEYVRSVLRFSYYVLMSTAK